MLLSKDSTTFVEVVYPVPATKVEVVATLPSAVYKPGCPDKEFLADEILSRKLICKASPGHVSVADKRSSAPPG